jgi:formate dehydrogenase iron-sulfur subunit
MASLDIKARSASTSPAPSARSTLEIAKMVDVSRCIGCKACQSACMEWNDLRGSVGTNDGFYTNPADLNDQTWTLMRFREEEINDSLQWLILKDGCFHCEDPGCLRACPAPGAIIQFSNGIVDFQQDACIGCGYCIAGCPFNIPRLRKEDSKVYKCTLCSDRVAVGLGYAQAAVYDPKGVGGTHVVMVLPHGDRPESYGLPAHPRVGPALALWRSGLARTAGVVTMFGVLVAGILHYMRHGPLEVPEEKKEG